MEEIRELLLHQLHADYVEFCQRFVENHGVSWVNLPAGAKGLYRLKLPPGTHLVRDDTYNNPRYER